MSNPPRLLLRLALNILLAGLASLLPSILTAVLTYYAVVYLLHLPFIIVVGLAPLYYIVAKWCFKLFFLALARAQLRPVKEGLHGPGFEDENIRNWLINISLVDAVKYFVGDPPLGQTALRPPFLRLLGAKLGKGVSLDDVTDPYLVEMEDGAVAGAHSFIASHLSRDGKLYLKKVKIGRGALIGVRSTIFPGVEIGEGAVVAAHSLVPMDTKIPPYTLWAGAPARQVETLRRKEAKQ